MLIFVYGTLRRGQGNNRLLADSRFVGSAKTIERFAMVDLGFYPAAVRVPGASRIVGDVYEVDGKTLTRLDALEGYPHHYDRVHTSVDLDDGRSFWVWMYVYRELPEGKLISSGDWLNST